MRNITTVVDQIETILEPVPSTAQTIIVQATLEIIKKQAPFYPTEGQLPLWTELGAVLYRQFGSFNPMPAWAEAISKVVQGQ